MNKLEYYKVIPEAHPLKFGTQDAACFDIAASIVVGQTIKRYDQNDKEVWNNTLDSPEIALAPFSRVLVPTNLIFAIPEGHSVRLHPRSGLALKQGIVLANMEGVIDADYVDPVFVMLLNISGFTQVIHDGDRIAQGEMVPMLRYGIGETLKQPQRYGNRTGGFGSTGV